MKKALFYGILASFFFAFTFLLNRSMHLAGGYWLWSACLRYLFTFPILAAVLAISGKKQKTRPLSHTWAEITKAPGEWFLWSSVGFVLFYAPLTFGSTFGESWLAAATWQLTIVAGILLTPLWGKPIPIRNLSWSCLILAGVFLLQVPNMRQMKLETMALTLIPILIAAFSYPLGNRKVMSLVSSDISTLERVYAMTLCSLPVWIFLLLFCLCNGTVQFLLQCAFISIIIIQIQFFNLVRTQIIGITGRCGRPALFFSLLSGPHTVQLITFKRVFSVAQNVSSLTGFSGLYHTLSV